MCDVREKDTIPRVLHVIWDEKSAYTHSCRLLVPLMLAPTAYVQVFLFCQAPSKFRVSLSHRNEAILLSSESNS